MGVCSASYQANTYGHVQPRYTGPLASSVPAGVGGKIIPVSDTYEVASAKNAFFRAYDEQLARIFSIRNSKGHSHGHGGVGYSGGVHIGPGYGGAVNAGPVHASGAGYGGPVHGNTVHRGPVHSGAVHGGARYGGAVRTVTTVHHGPISHGGPGNYPGH
ncbi:hypothetical protein Pmani_011083 [Petrolisthes manimaculis]|uniref:Uncharacterized protein n=1 Tax=Petrolisthes manimaculis TaxID=1843537 RepID=A0AAE1Q093_9EUCA|nr:hypothetical protein Pmani_011083 [Petrolisthes manimaculis]